MRLAKLLRYAAAAALLTTACNRETEFGLAGNVNIRLSFKPAKVSADKGTTVVTIDVDNFAGQPLHLDDVKITTSAGFDKVGPIVANSANRFTVALQGLTDLKQSPVKVKVNIGRAVQTGFIDIVPGAPSALQLTVDKETVSADEGTVNLILHILDKSKNVTPGSVRLSTTAGVVSQLVNRPDGSYTAKLTGLINTADSPVEIAAVAGDSRAETVVQILAGELDHFTVSQLPATIVAGDYTLLFASAHDKNGNLVTAFEDFAYVRTTRGSGDVEVSHKTGSGAYVAGAEFTRQFVLGQLPKNPAEAFRVKTAAPAPGISLILQDSASHRGQSNPFVVEPAPANQIVMYSQSGFNLIVSADGCVKPTEAGPECLIGATQYSNGNWKQSPLATRLEIKLRRYNQSPDEADGVATLLGGRGSDFLLTMSDADGTSYCAVTPTETCATEIEAGTPYLGALEDKLNGLYYVNVYNLRDQSKSPFTVTARFVSLVQSIDVAVVPGDLSTFSLPEMPAQRAGAIGIFFLTITARDLWKNQVFSFQDTTSVFLKVGANPPQFLVQAPAAILGATFPFTVTIPTDGTYTASLLAQHGSGISGLSNSFLVVPQVHTTTNFVPLLPGQYDAPPPAAPAFGNGFQGVPATLTPDLGQVTSADTAADQVVGEPFEILLLARISGLAAPVADFQGKVLLGGIGSTFEIIDDSCAYNNAPTAGVAPSQLTPNFISTWTGAGGGVPLLRYESSCYVRVRATQRAEQSLVTVDAGRSSGIPVSFNGDQSSQVRIRSAEAVGLRFGYIATPQLATANPDGGQNLFTIRVQGIDSFGNLTDNVYCASPILSSNVQRSGQDVLMYTKSPAPQFDVNGVLTIDDAWINLPVDNNHPVNIQLTVECGVSGMIAQSNVFTVVNAGAVGYEFMLVPAKVKAHQSFTFSARACNVMDGAGKHCASENDVARTFTYAVTMTDTTGTLGPRQTRAFSSGILDNQIATIEKVGSTKLCLYALGAFSCSDPITVEIGDVSYFQFDTTAFPTAVTVGEKYNISALAYDAGGNSMPNFFGTIYLSDYQNQVKIANNGLASAYVTTAVDAADGNKSKLFYCTTTSCATRQLLQVVFSDSNALDYLIITDNRTHTGYSLPKTFRVVYGPVGNVVEGPCAKNSDVRQRAYFTLCAQAQSRNNYLNAWVLKKDYTAAGTDLVVSSRALYPENGLPFTNGVAQKSFYVLPATAPVEVRYRFQVSGLNYPASPAPAYTFNTYPPVTHTVSSTSVTAGTKVNTPFELLLQVTTGGNPDTTFQGVLKVTDTTGSIRPYCGTGQPAGHCGHLDGNTLFTGNLNDPFSGEREQWFTIPTENYGGYIYVTDGFGQNYRYGPFDVEGNLGSFTFSAIPVKIPSGVYVRVVITAWDIYDQVMTSFRAPVLLDNVPHNLNPDNSSNPWLIPATAWLDGRADISFKVPVPSPVGVWDHLTVKFNGSQTVQANSNDFRAELPVLTKLEWGPVPVQQPGYVDFPISLSAKDQFGSLSLFSGRVLFSASGGYATRPTISTNFVNGVLGGSPPFNLALDGTLGNTRITATQLGGSVTGTSSPVTVAASTVASFSVMFTSSTFKTNCTYGLEVNALAGDGSIVSTFTGSVGLRWIGNLNIPVTTDPDTASFSPALTPKFTGGHLSTSVKILGQQSFLVPAAMPVNVWVLGTGIQGTTTPQYDVQPAGPCP